ncbi:hypothetical protein GCM10020358_13140 [Amorphoplanes nipponensis]
MLKDELGPSLPRPVPRPPLFPPPAAGDRGDRVRNLVTGPTCPTTPAGPDMEEIGSATRRLLAGLVAHPGYRWVMSAPTCLGRWVLLPAAAAAVLGR